MAETPLTETDLSADSAKWSATGFEVTMAAPDNAEGNSFNSAADALVVVTNVGASPQTFQLTSQALTGNVGAGRTGDVSQSIAAGEIRVFRVTRNGWADSNGLVLLPSGLHADLRVGVVKIR